MYLPFPRDNLVLLMDVRVNSFLLSYISDTVGNLIREVTYISIYIKF